MGMTLFDMIKNTHRCTIGNFRATISQSKTDSENHYSLSSLFQQVGLLGALSSCVNVPIAVSNGEGRAEFSSHDKLQAPNDNKLIPLHYIDNYGAVTESYPANPSSSPAGIAGVKSGVDGRVLASMP